ncbi:OpgC family protein [Afifella pfennigii]|uniref:OpgC family protein n=1 Tax=Afifella pfennigii TaxID=209897 RepID=UPI00047BE3E4|nr:OpgC domain-containing protein [Afifella pfennigii]
MARAPNAVDFWRGFALVSIFVNHVPGNIYGALTHRNVSFSDSADLFVFLAGWALRIVTDRAGCEAGSFQPLALRLLARSWKIYAAQLVSVFLAIAILAAAALLTHDVNYLTWNSARPIFEAPVTAHIGLVLLTYHLNLFDILPLYVVLTLMAIPFALLDRRAPALVLPLSLAIYAATLLSGWQLRTWPYEGTWLFNPFSWQLIFILGFVLGGENGVGGWARRHLVAIRRVALPALLVFAAVQIWQLWPAFDDLPAPKLLFSLDRTFAAPLRIVQLLALIAVFSAVFPFIARHAGGLVGFLSRLGRNSLYVFCVGSILSLLGLIVRVEMGGGVVLDTATVALGIAALWLTAWLAETPRRSQRPNAATERV